MALKSKGVGHASEGKAKPLIDQLRGKKDRGGAALIRQDSKKWIPGPTPEYPENE
jgi:hypothetical protein